MDGVRDSLCLVETSPVSSKNFVKRGRVVNQMKN